MPPTTGTVASHLRDAPPSRARTSLAGAHTYPTPRSLTVPHQCVAAAPGGHAGSYAFRHTAVPSTGTSGSLIERSERKSVTARSAVGWSS